MDHRTIISQTVDQGLYFKHLRVIRVTREQQRKTIIAEVQFYSTEK
jgi:hypothetical protein